MKKILLIICLFLPVVISSQGFICAVGGGPEDYKDWSDKPYNWIVEKSGKGKIIILSANSETEWIPNYFKSFGAAGAVNLKISTKEIANQQSTYDAIVSSSTVFIKGGDQWDYISNWKNTKTAEAIKQVFKNGGVIAGTSAGAMSLSGVVFTAKNNSAYPKESLINPFYSAINLEDDFLNLVPNSIIDTHVAERGRIARLIPFMFNYFVNAGKEILGIGIDDMTALCIEPNGVATVYGSGAVSFFQKDERTKYENSTSGYLIQNLKCEQLVQGWSYDLINKKVFSKPESAKQIVLNRKTELPSTDIWFSGSNDVQSNIDQSLSAFLQKYNPVNVCVISSSGNESSLQIIRNYLDSKSIASTQIIISGESIDNPQEAEKLANAPALVFAGNDLPALSRLKDSSLTLARAIKKSLINHSPVYSFGNSGKVLCGNYIDKVDGKTDASYRGAMTNNSGLNLFGDLIFQPMVFSSDDYYENRVSAMLYGMMRNRKKFGLFLDTGNYASIQSSNSSVNTSGSMPLFVIDASESDWVDSSLYRASGSASTRQLVAITNLRYNISSISKRYSFSERSVVTSIKESREKPLQINYRLENNYPNPFNGSTIIRFSLNKAAYASLSIYNLLGQEVQKLIENNLEIGNYSLSFSPNDSIASGIYMYKFSTPEFSQVKKMIYLR
jgi:cyanophycinase